MRALVLLLAAALLLVGAPERGQAQAGRITVGLFAPSAPFSGPEERVSFVEKVAQHLAGATGKAVSGRVFARAGDLAAAVKKGEVQLVIVDAPYAAGSGLPYDPLAAAVRGGGAQSTWELVVASGVSSLRELKDRTVLVPGVGGRESAFVFNALLGGHVPPNWFKVSAASDAASAVAAVGVGRADAAVVPGGMTLPAGTRRLTQLAQVGWPMFAAAPGVDAATRSAFAAAILSYRGDTVFTGFAAAGGGEYGKLAKSFSPASRRGPMVVPPPAQFDARGLLAGRHFAIPRSELHPLVQSPSRKAPAGK